MSEASNAKAMGAPDRTAAKAPVAELQQRRGLDGRARSRRAPDGAEAARPAAAAAPDAPLGRAERFAEALRERDALVQGAGRANQDAKVAFYKEAARTVRPGGEAPATTETTAAPTRPGRPEERIPNSTYTGGSLSRGQPTPGGSS